MSDGNENKKPRNFEEMTKSPFFTFSKSYLDFITKGKVFGIVYMVMAVVNLILPFILLYVIIDSGIFEAGAQYVFAVIFAWLVFVFACWIGFQIWFQRRKAIEKAGSSQFMVTVLFSELFQTFGEWLGTFIGIIGAGVGLIAAIFLGDDASDLFRVMGLRGLAGAGIAVIVIGPIIGALIIIVSWFIAEQMRMFAQLVNNTGDIARK